MKRIDLLVGESWKAEEASNRELYRGAITVSVGGTEENNGTLQPGRRSVERHLLQGTS
jgi:hypothetical protein